ncbi:hypothetical protein A2714_02745 [Candidatus Woesebacteria bacterium RIFCSPHIGHO2_01_FULL_38_9]|uniref:PEP-utilising enzyme mobile domain-containing protein n=2 Tax=Candidatus Woeseibacteriota TaxID=1752722 RepID=A0A1F7Y4F5_9BACT|nr:MAG: hypothetical protein A2714_02745 [Candidatus Woesebacteria bacterium RIFCSPHIGHO2_01_FULL_38_9]OGM60378.1 MAG: hypothetical protein A3A75_03990 [Candidatus Woesebacteria bacterium RIFCSPLOWO2_01_FULL_39_10]
MKILLKKIKTKKWNFYVTRKFNWFVQNTQILANSQKTLLRDVGFDSSQDNYLILNGDEYYTDEESEKYFNLFENLFNIDSNFFVKFANKEFEIVKKIEKFKKSLNKINVSKLSNKNLANLILEFQEYYTLSFVPAFSRPDDYLEAKVKELIENELKLSGKKVDYIFSKVATYPSLGRLAYTNEPLNLLEITKLIKDGTFSLEKLPPKIMRKLEKHKENYSWMKSPVSVELTHFNKEEYLERLKNLVDQDVLGKIEKIKNVRKLDALNYKEVIRKYKFSPQLKKLCEAVRKFIFLRTYTTEISDNLFYEARKILLNEVAKRLNFTTEDIVMLNSSEISTFILNPSNQVKEIIKERYKGYAIIWMNGITYINFGNLANKLQGDIAKLFKKTKGYKAGNVFIKGTPASLGVVQGKAKILPSYKEVSKVEKGDILVTSMTTPDYIIAMEKAAAFVTDEGGITCHAAIIAREFGVPCIVGTINATKVLKDGDMVEVDANIGTVKILR